jgi:hypothetical protein
MVLLFGYGRLKFLPSALIAERVGIVGADRGQFIRFILYIRYTPNRSGELSRLAIPPRRRLVLLPIRQAKMTPCPHPEDQKYFDPCISDLVCNRCGTVLILYSKGIPPSFPYPVWPLNSGPMARVVDTNRPAATISCPINWVPVEVSQEILDKAKVSEKVTLPCGHTVPAKEVLKRASA